MLPTPISDIPSHTPSPSSLPHHGSTTIPFPPNTTTTPAARRSSRVSHPSSYLKDIHCNLSIPHSVSTSSKSLISYPISQSLSYNSLCPSYKTFILNISAHIEPQYYHHVSDFSIGIRP